MAGPTCGLYGDGAAAGIVRSHYGCCGLVFLYVEKPMPGNDRTRLRRLHRQFSLCTQKKPVSAGNSYFFLLAGPGKRLTKVGMGHHYFRHNCVRVLVKNLLTQRVLSNFLRAPLPFLEEQC